MFPLAIIEQLKVLESVRLGLFSRFIVLVENPFGFQLAEEAFNRDVIHRPSTPGKNDPVCLSQTPLADSPCGHSDHNRGTLFLANASDCCSDFAHIWSINRLSAVHYSVLV